MDVESSVNVVSTVDGDSSEHSGSHTPHSTSRDGTGKSNESSANTSRTSTPRTRTPPRPTHVITMDAYKQDKAKNHKRLQKMLGMLFHVSGKYIFD